MKRFSRDAEDEAISNINVTPFVDVLLVLLIIFMITAPIVTQSINIKLPKTNLKASKSVGAPRKFVISIGRRGNFFLNNKQILSKHVYQRAKRWSKKYPNDSIFIRADRRVAYGKVARIMAKLKYLGITNIGLLVEKTNQ
ncbi:MAG: biopolymer transport protein TolR [bacterium]|jgi:biopolymer transport protein TolR